MSQTDYVVVRCTRRAPLYITGQCTVIALIADPAQEWGRQFAPAEPVFEVSYDDGRTEYHSANERYIQAAG
jgi:hypothetical protein